MERNKRHRSEQIIRKLRDADRMLSEGKDIAAVCQALKDRRGDIPSLAEPVRRDEGR